MSRVSFIPCFESSLLRIVTVVTLFDFVSLVAFFADGRPAGDDNCEAARSVPSLKVDVDLVLLNVTVTGTRHGIIPGLGAEHFSRL